MKNVSQKIEKISNSLNELATKYPNYESKLRNFLKTNFYYWQKQKFEDEFTKIIQELEKFLVLE